MKKNIYVVILSLILATSSAIAGDTISGDEAIFIPNIQPRLEISKTSAKIVIDGDLNDAGWVGANIATNFTQAEPVDMIKPSSKTVAMLTFDDASDNKFDFAQADRQYFMKFQYLFRI